MYYLTSYKHLKRTFFGREKFKADKHTQVLEKIEDYNPTVAVHTAIELGHIPQYWNNCFDVDLNNKKQYYHEFQIPKRNGKMRDIKEPIGEMKLIQRNICFKMKSELKILPHDCCHGFVKGRRCLSAMQKHQDNNSMWFLKLDISNFFPSISSGLIYETFKYIPQMAMLPVEIRRMLVNYLTDETGHLTQGCISSPYIANLVLLDFDYKFSEYCRNNNLVYTRYADDMCISSRVKFNPKLVEREVKRLLPPGIKLNSDKTKLTSINCQNVFLGIHYNQAKELTVGHETKHLMKVIAHKAELGQIPDDEKQTWKGRLSYYTSIEPDYFKQPRFDIIRSW